MGNQNDELQVVEEKIVVKDIDDLIEIRTEEEDLELTFVDESVVLVEAPVTETMFMETQTTDDCPYLDTCRITNHALLYNRDSADQHPITAITGLEDRLNKIETIDNLKSVSDIMGIYYPWYDSYDRNDRTGYFVSYHPKGSSGNGGIVIYNGSYSVIGVTVTNAGYIGNYAETVIDGMTVGREDDINYGLVALSGVVNVRATGSPAIGGYVIANEHGMAEATDNTSGYRVLAKGNNGVYDFVTIFLGVSQNSLAELYDTVIGLSEFTEEDQKRLQECVTSDELAELLSKLEFTINGNIDSAVGKVEDDLGLTKEELEDLIGEAKEKAEAAQSSATAIQTQVIEMQKAVGELESSVESDIKGIRSEMESTLSETKETVDRNLNDAMTELGVVADNLNSISDEFAEGGTIATMQEQITENSAKLESVVAGNLSNVESITMIQQQVNENGGMITQLVMDISKYSVGPYSQSYGMSYDDAVSILVDDIIYVPTLTHTENLIRDQLVSASENIGTVSGGTLEERETDANVAELSPPPFEALEVNEMQTTVFEVASGLTYRYLWNGSEWNKGDPVLMSTDYFEYDGTSATTDLWYVWKDVIKTEDDGSKTIYEAGTLYKWEDTRWFAVAHIRDNLTARSINQVRQTAESYSIQLNDLKGNFSLYEQTVDHIKQVVGGEDGDFGSFTVTKDGLYGEVFNPNGTAAALRAKVDSTRALMDLFVSGYYHDLAYKMQSTIDPYDGRKFTVQPTWDKDSGKFIFNDVYRDDINGVYYFFDADQTHYCKAVGDYYEVYKCGNLTTAGVDAETFPDKASVNLMATLGNDTVSSVAGLRNLALENEAKTELIASLSKDALQKIQTPDEFVLDENLIRYTERPKWNDANKKYVFDSSSISDNGLYVVGETADTYRKLISDGSDGFIGYEVYKHDTSATAGLVAQVLENEQRVGIVVSEGGAVKGGVVVEAINKQITNTIDGDRLNIKGITTISGTDNDSNNKTIIDGGSVSLTNIVSTTYSDIKDPLDNYSDAGTKFDFAAGTVISKNFAIDANGNAYFRGDITGCTGIFKGQIQVGEYKDDDGNTMYNFEVDSDGHVTANSGTFTGTMQATDIFVYDSNEGDYVSILDAATKKIKADRVESLSVNKLITGKVDSYYIKIDGNDIRFRDDDDDDIAVLKAWTNENIPYFTVWGSQLELLAGDTLQDTYPYFTMYPSNICMFVDGNTGIQITNNVESHKICLNGDVYVNDVPYGVAVFG